MSAKPGTATGPRTGPWRVQSSAWHKGTRSAYVMTSASAPKERGAVVARVYVSHPDGQCDSARAMLATLAAGRLGAATPVLIAALRSAVGSGSPPAEVAQAARDALAAAGG